MQHGMIKFLLEADDDHPDDPLLLGQWLTRENVARLMEGKPISFELPGLKVFISYHETIEEGHAALEELLGVKFPPIPDDLKTEGKTQ